MRFAFGGKANRAELTRVKFDDELFVDDGIDLLAGGDANHGAAEVFLIHEQPIGNGNDLREFDTALAEALGFFALLNGDDIAGLEVHRGNVGLAAIDGHMAVADHLARSAQGLREAHFLNDIVKTGLEELEQDHAGNATTAAGDIEVAAELALEDSILVAEFLLFS